jgi:hypothetical protein
MFVLKKGRVSELTSIALADPLLHRIADYLKAPALLVLQRKVDVA